MKSDSRNSANSPAQPAAGSRHEHSRNSFQYLQHSGSSYPLNYPSMEDNSPPSQSAVMLSNTEFIQLLECSVCLSLLCEPISISCGHTFCRTCLVKSLRRHKKKCPSCREVCHTSAENACENVVIKSLAIAADAGLYAQKLAESAVERATWNAEYPIFFYNQTMFPSNVLNLHLFEPRYRVMMTRIVNSSRAFAYVTRNRLAVGDLALVAELRNTEFLPDGRCIVEASLCKRSRIVEFFEEDGTQGLWYCRLEPISDDAVLPENADTLAALKTRAMQLAERVLADSTARRAVEEQFGRMPTETEAFSMWFASISPLSDGEKSLALHTRDTTDRLQMCTQRLESHLDGRRNRSFPVANAIGNTLSSTLAALLGVATGAGATPAAAPAPNRSSGARRAPRAARAGASATTGAAAAGEGSNGAGNSDDDIPGLVSDSDSSSDDGGHSEEDGSDMDMDSNADEDEGGAGPGADAAEEGEGGSDSDSDGVPGLASDSSMGSR